MAEGVRQTAKLVIKTFLRLRERATVARHELVEAWDDLLAEARHEQAAAGIAAVDGSPAAPARKVEAATKAGPRANDGARSTAARAAAPAPTRLKRPASRRRSAGGGGTPPLSPDPVRLKPEDRADTAASKPARRRARRAAVDES